MKRPLCAIGGLLAVVVFFLVQILPTGESNLPADRQVITIIGEISGKENRINSFSGEKQLVVYLKKDNGKKVMLYIDDAEYNLPFGCFVKAKGKVKLFSEGRNPGEFDSRNYYRILKIEYCLTDVQILGIGGEEDGFSEGIYNVRLYLEQVLDNVLRPKDAGVMKAVLLGNKNGLDEDIKEAFTRNGIIHIMAVSGLHISIIGMTLYKLIRRTGAGIIISALSAISVMYMYGVMCGMSTSAFRAIIMFMVRLFADVIGRTYDMLSALSLAGIMLLCSQPLYIKHSGFLMSFGAVLAIGYVLPSLPEVIRKGKLKIFSASLSIMLVTLPVYMSFYYTYPVYSIFLNVLILPLMSLLMLFGILCIFLGTVFLPSGVMAGTVCHLIIRWFIFCCDVGSSIPGSTWYAGHAGILQVVLYLMALGMFVILKSGVIEEHINPYLEDKRKRRFLFFFEGIRYFILFAGIIVLCIRIRPELRITALDVGQGDGIVIETKTANYLIDGGSTSKKNIAKYQLIPFLSYSGISKLNAVIMTHEDEDHISGILELMDEMEKSRGSIRIENLILPKVDEASKGNNYLEIERKAKECGIPVMYIGRGDRINDSDMEVCCIGPQKNMITDEPNAYSTVLYLRKGEFSGLFTGDVDGQGQEDLREYIRENREKFKNLTLLKVAHHGSRYTTDEEFLDLIMPRIAIISCGIKNRYHHPHKEVIDRLEKIGTRTYITAESGAIITSLDDNRLKINTYID